MTRIRPKNWSEFQHYKDRRPPWIKLHRGLLDDRAFHRLPVVSRALAPMLWLIASESDDGSFDGSPADLAFRLRCSEKEVENALKPLIDNGFFELVHDASKAQADRLHVAPLVEERRGEGETEAETEKSRGDAPAALPAKRDRITKPDGVQDQTWLDWLALRKSKKAPVTATVINGALAEAEKAGMSIDAFLREWCTRGSQGLKADWIKPTQATTVPAPKGPDPALQKILEDRAKAAPMPEEIRRQIALVTRKA